MEREKQYIIEVVSNKNLFSNQKYHIRIKDYNNHEILLTSEKYVNKSFCLEMAEKFNKNLKNSILEIPKDF